MAPAYRFPPRRDTGSGEVDGFVGIAIGPIPGPAVWERSVTEGSDLGWLHVR